MPKDSVVYTDLDGTLLDHETYSFHPAKEALELLEKKGVPLVICTSKTRAEIEFVRKLLGNTEPFISENGGGIFIPEGYFNPGFEYDRTVKHYEVIELGTRSEILRNTLKEISEETGARIIGFSDLSAKELSELTGLDEHTARLSQIRDYSEPFLVYGDQKDTESVVEKIYLKGYRYTRGGRFHHILGENDKGNAVRILTDIYKRELENVQTIGLGDSLNDLPMLKEVDIPILVQKPKGDYDSCISLDNIIYADSPGPYGWNSEILKLFMNS